MKFKVSSNDLLKKLQLAAGAIGSNPVLPILEDFLFSVEGQNLTIAATDLETTVSTTMELVESEIDGNVAIPGKILLDTLKELPEQPLSFQVDDASFSIEITSAFGKYRLAGENGNDFPKIPQPEPGNELVVQSHHLLDALSKTIFATSNDELRPAMMGVFFQVEPGKITAVATDAHKLVKYAFTDVQGDATTSMIIPKKAVNLLKGTLKGGNVSMSFDRTHAFFKIDDSLLACRLIEAKYPDYNAVIPVGNANILNLERSAFLRSLKRISVYANKTTNQVVLSINEGSLTLSSQDLDFSNEATEQLACNYDGEPITIGFNAKFLIEMLGVLDSDEINLKLSTPTKAGILVPEAEMEGTELLMLVMPVMLNN